MLPCIVVLFGPAKVSRLACLLPRLLPAETQVMDHTVDEIPYLVIPGVWRLGRTECCCIL
jgi:hypothetical protein